MNFNIVERVVVKPQVVDSNGVIIRDAYQYTVTERSGSRFRSITDLKGFDDRELNVEPSQTDVSGYVDNRLIIQKILDNSPLDALRVYMRSLSSKDAEVEEDINNTADISDDVDDLDVITMAGDISQEINGRLHQAQQSNSKNTTSADKRSMSEDKQVVSDAD